MYLKILISICCVLLLISTSHAITHREYFDRHLEKVEDKIQQNGFKGPISKNLAKWATSRQVLEDGVNRPSTISVAGLSIGEPNTAVVNEVLKDKEIQISKARDSEGGVFYSFKGKDANIYSAVIIAKLFNVYVYKFMKPKITEWEKAKETSHAISLNPDSFELNHKFYTQLCPEKLLEKACSIYGPGKPAINSIIKEIEKEKWESLK